MALHGVAVAGLGGLAQIAHRAVEPLLRRLAEPKAGVAAHALAAASSGQQLGPQDPSGGDAPLDCAPALHTGPVLETDLKDTRGSAVDVALHTLAARRRATLAHAVRPPVSSGHGPGC